MANVRPRGESVRRFIIDNIADNPADIARLTAAQFSISRQAVNKHLHTLLAEGYITQSGNTRSRKYELAALEKWHKSYSITESLSEDRPWLHDVLPALAHLPENVVQIWHYGFTEMFNNAIDHSEGSSISIELTKTAATTTLMVIDDGIGIFKKIQAALDLLDERQAPLELAKGKFTTDPRRHSGEGVFFTSRMFDDFAILSGSVAFTHEFGDNRDWIHEREASESGTAVIMELSNHTARTSAQVFDQFSNGEDYGFTRTIVPVTLATYGDDNLVSRSQARRLLTRFERFRTVVLDFSDVDSIGQAFADELFRVFPTLHPDVELLEVQVSPEVRKMISRARSHS